MKINKKAAIFLGIISAFLIKANFVLALEITYPDIFGKSFNSTSSFFDYICYLFNLGAALAFSAAILSLAFGGVYYLVSYGRGSFTSEGKEWIKAGLLGLLIVTCASLIANTINSNMSTCKLGFLPTITLEQTSTNGSPIPPDIKTYQEVPIGTLTETLLTRTMDCYGFDQEGNPVPGKELSKGKFAPTYLNHDRADCITQLVDGAQKKAQMIATLSEGITNLMNQCDCAKYGKCQEECDPIKGCQYTKCPNGTCGKFEGSCVGGSCLQKPDTSDCCPDNSGVVDPKTGKEISVKEQIEHGPVRATVETGSSSPNGSCKTQEMQYDGLDEFRTKYNNNYNAIKAAVEKTITVDDKQMEIIEVSKCTSCTYGCSNCNNDCSSAYSYCVEQNPSYTHGCEINKKVCEDNYNQCITRKNACESDYSNCLNNLSSCRKKSAWGKLPLIDQLTYFKGKINEIKQKIKDDENLLYKATDTMNNSLCYMAMPYIDFAKTYDSTNQYEYSEESARIVLTKKFSDIRTGQTVLDPETKKPIDVSRYCNGFNYNSSSCLKKCNDMCPDTSDDALQCYQKCGECKDGNPQCIEKQKKCTTDCYNSRPCANASEDNPHTNFEECINSCQDGCSLECSNKYLACSAEYDLCINQCNNNSQCVLDNTSSCLFNSNSLFQCAQSSDSTYPENTADCVDRAYLCKNGSDQYAGYPDCVETNNDCSINVYSASFLYDNKDCQKCYNPAHNSVEPGNKPYRESSCYSDDPGSIKSCQSLCPEIEKCPSTSRCPNCPCDQIDQTLEFSVPNVSTKANSGKAGYHTTENPVLAYQIVGPQCNSYSYNDDPLTFYCEYDWKNNPKNKENGSSPLGMEKRCPASGEVPVGQTIDDAEKWADKLIGSIDGSATQSSYIQSGNNINQDIQDIIDQMTKIGEAKDTNPIQDYCKCDAKFDTNEPICTTDCKYNQRRICWQGDCYWLCQCSFVPCEGSPCEQITDYLSELWNDYRQFKIDFIDFYTTMMTEPRSDVMKELTYSRQSTSNCSIENNVYGVEANLLDCTRVEEELIDPIKTDYIDYNGRSLKGYCYGKKLGNLFNESLTDNWFCCQKFSNTAPIKTQP